MWSDKSSLGPACPFCRQPLSGWADLGSDSGAMRVHTCDICGRYAITSETAPLVARMDERTRLLILANLETRALPREVEGTVLLRPEHFAS